MMRHLVRVAWVGVALLLPMVASCPRPTPGPGVQERPENLLAPGQPLTRDPVTFRIQMQGFLEKGSETADSAAAKTALRNSLNWGLRQTGGAAEPPPVPGVTFDPNTIKCGGGGCWVAVHHASANTVEAFQNRVLASEGAPFHKWVGGAGRTHHEPAGNGVSVVWFFMNPSRSRK
jgi:hypothetical protein